MDMTSGNPGASLKHDAEDAVLSGHAVVCVANGFQTNYERGFCNALAGQGAQVTLISSDTTDRAGLDVAVRTVNLRRSQDNKRPKWKKLLNVLRYHAEVMLYAPLCATKIIHMIGNFDPPFLCGVVEGLWFRLWARRYVLTVHDVLPHERHTALNQIISRWTFHIASALVVHTVRMKRKLIESYGVAATKVTVMQHGIEPHATESHADEKLNAARIQDGTPTILFFGKVAPYKGVDLLLNALGSVSFPFRLVIAGAAAFQDYRGKIMQAVAAHPCRGSIVWHDEFIAEADMEQLFREADVLVLPYRHIDQSGVLFQALRFGVPIVATRVGAFEDFVSPDVGVLADDVSPEGLARALERWHLRRSSISRTHIRVVGHGYEWSRTIKALRAVY